MKKVKLMMVSSENNNKYYNMSELGDGTFEVRYGRVGGHETVLNYKMYEWNSTYNSKLKKGYKDVTDLFKENTDNSISFKSKSFESFYKHFDKYSKKSNEQNYSISTDAVTSSMLEEAQSNLDRLIQENNIIDANKLLLDIFSILPRKMEKVQNYLANKKTDLDNIIKREQTLLDSLKSSVITKTNTGEYIENLLSCELQEVDLEEVIETVNLINNTNKNRERIYKIFKYNSSEKKTNFESFKDQLNTNKTEFLIHGTRNENIFPILKTGLLIRPSNAVYTGSAYGDGIYHSKHATKSLGYTGYDLDKILLIQEVIIGNSYIYDGWFRESKGISKENMNFNYLKSKGYHSVYVKPGDGLLNSEIIVYHPAQTLTRFVIWMK